MRTFRELRDAISAEVLLALPDSNLDSSTPFGVIIDIVSKFAYDTESKYYALYQAQDIDLATGQQLDVKLKERGLIRGAGSNSTCIITVTSNRDVTLLAGYSLIDQNNEAWILKNDVNLLIGDNQVTFEAETIGDVQLLAGEILRQAKFEPFVVSAIAAIDALEGTKEETDFDFRRRAVDISKNSVNAARAISNVLTIDGVKYVEMYENDTPAIDAVLGMPPHSVWTIVDGGNAQDILAKLYETAGNAYYKGSISQTFAGNKTIRFDVVDTKDLHIRMNAAGKTGFFVNQGAIIDKLKAHEYPVRYEVTGQDIIIQVSDNTIVLSSIEFSEDGTTWTSTLSTLPNERFKVINVVVTV